MLHHVCCKYGCENEHYCQVQSSDDNPNTNEVAVAVAMALFTTVGPVMKSKR
jgi:hypothetical protein